MRTITATVAISLALLVPSAPVLQPRHGAQPTGLTTLICRAFPSFCS